MRKDDDDKRQSFQPIFSNTDLSLKNVVLMRLLPPCTRKWRRNRFRTWPRLFDDLSQRLRERLCFRQNGFTSTASNPQDVARSGCRRDPSIRDEVSTLLREEATFSMPKRTPLSHARTRTHTHTPKVVERVLRLHSVSFLLFFFVKKEKIFFLSFLSLSCLRIVYLFFLENCERTGF